MFAVMSFGGHIGTVAHAQTAQATLTPEQAAALQQTLQVLKAKLANLQMQAGQIPAGDGGSASVVPTATVTPQVSVATGLSAQDITAINSTLGALASALGNLNATIAQHPDRVATNQQAISAVLLGMTNTLASINSQIARGTTATQGSGVAVTPSTPATTGSGNGVAAVTPSTPSVPSTPSTPVTTPATTPATTPVVATNNSNTQTANIFSSSWNFVKAHWPTFTIILLVIAILLILFWPQSEEEMGANAHKVVVKPQQPSRPVMTVNVASSPAPGTTPVSTVVATPAVQKIDVQAMKAKKPAF